MKPLDSMPKRTRARKEGLRTPQIRILRLLAHAKQPLTRKGISEATKINQTLTSWALGYEDVNKRKDFEAKDGGYPSLLTLKYVDMHVLDIDGVVEVTYEINAAGRRGAHETRAVKLPD